MKDATIMIRVTMEQKLAIKRMARKQGMTITEFMLFSLMKSFNKVELDYEGKTDTEDLSL